MALIHIQSDFNKPEILNSSDFQRTACTFGVDSNIFLQFKKIPFKYSRKSSRKPFHSFTSTGQYFPYQVAMFYLRNQNAFNNARLNKTEYFYMTFVNNNKALSLELNIALYFFATQWWKLHPNVGIALQLSSDLGHLSTIDSDDTCIQSSPLRHWLVLQRKHLEDEALSSADIPNPDFSILPKFQLKG